MPRSTFLTPLPNGCSNEAAPRGPTDTDLLPWKRSDSIGAAGRATPVSGEGASVRPRVPRTRTFPCISSRMVSVTFKPPSMTPVSILSCVGLSQAASVLRSLVAGQAELRTREGLHLRGRANPPRLVSDPSQGDSSPPMLSSPLDYPPGSFRAMLLSKQWSEEPIHGSSAPQQAAAPPARHFPGRMD